jgi:hypothetical protein
MVSAQADDHTQHRTTLMKHIKIAAHYQSLAAAVEAAAPDLSYNPDEARRRIRDIDLNCRQAFVTENGDIYYVFDADIRLLHKFSPFVSVMSDSPFVIAFIVGNTLSIGNHEIPKNKAGREFFKNNPFGAIAA